MLEFLAELILSLFGDILLQGATEALMEFGFESLSSLCRSQRATNPLLAGCGLALVGGALGLVFALLAPHRLLPAAHFPGLSLLVAPVGVGWLMHTFGRWRRKRGGNPTSLATFWGGAIFAFSLALVRWLMVGRG